MKRNKAIAAYSVDPKTLDFKGLKAAVVGGTGGIGRAISRFLALQGAKVVVVGQTFRDSDLPGIEFIKADLSLLSEARRIGKLLPAENLNLVIMTTGIFAAPQRQETAEGIERDMAVSYLNRLVMLDEIAPRLSVDRSAIIQVPRVFVMGFPGVGQTGTIDDLNSEKSYSAMTAHMNTVAGNEVLVLDGAKRYPKVRFFGLNPGIMKSNIRANLFGENSRKFRFMEGMLGVLGPSTDDYAQRIAGLLVSPEIEDHSGAMFDKKGRAIMPSPKLTDSYIRAFVAASEVLAARAEARGTPR